jgi:hypothetical protein
MIGMIGGTGMIRRRWISTVSIGLSLIAISGSSAMAETQGSDPDTSGSYRSCPSASPAPPIVPIVAEPPARLFADKPLPSHLAEGRVVIPYCVENIRIMPVFGEAALKVSPRIGHIHVTVDQGPWRWLDTSGQPVIVNLLPAGEHSILLELVDATHRTLDKQTVSFVIPNKRSQGGHGEQHAQVSKD